MMSKQLNSPTGQEKKNYAVTVRGLNALSTILNEYRNKMNNWKNTTDTLVVILQPILMTKTTEGVLV